MKRSPAYGKELIEARRKGTHINPWIFCGPDAWNLASRRGPGRLVLRHGEDPASFDWGCVSGLVPVVRWPGASIPECDELGALLVRAGARAVLVLDDLRPDPKVRGYRVLRPFRRYIGSRAQ